MRISRNQKLSEKWIILVTKMIGKPLLIREFRNLRQGMASRMSSH
jgi:hypothetical protein